jgi:hypothetical protein
MTSENKTLGKRGRLPSPGSLPPNKKDYKCKACVELVRGDRLQNHYRSKVDFKILKEVSLLDDESKKEKLNGILDEIVRQHTIFFLENGFNDTKLPEYKNHHAPSVVKRTPFEVCSDAHSKKKKTESLAPSELQDEYADEELFLLDEESDQGGPSIKTPSPTLFSNTPEPTTEQSSEKPTTPEPSLPEPNTLEPTIPTPPPSSFSTTPDFKEPYSPILEDNQASPTEPLSPSQRGAASWEEFQANFDKEVMQDDEIPTYSDKHILQSLKRVISSNEASDDIDQICEILASKIAIKTQELTQEPKIDIDDMWVKGDENYYCRCCLEHSISPVVPQKFWKFRKVSFGFVGVPKADKHSKWNLKRSIESHESNELHAWCKRKYEINAEKAKSDKMRSEQAGRLVVRNALFCFKQGSGAETFVALNDKDSMIESIPTATKNDSRREYFHLRDVVFEEVYSKVQAMMEEVDAIATTEDKVTVQRNSYLALLTYFFYNGKIHVFLNKLIKCTTQDYDGPGTAKVIVDTLKETLGLPITRLAAILDHTVYDGVYALPSQRKAGGGCLSLILHIANLLGLSLEDLTGEYDSSHLKQSLC